jgi:hypothetical protein
MGLVSGRRPVRVFISYAHESAEHEELVRRLWIFLRGCGLDARLDLPAADRRQDWAQWMTAEVVAADFVVVVASVAYRQRAEQGVGSGPGRGVQFEAALLRELLYADRDVWLPKMLPVVLPGGSTDGIPLFLGPNTCASYRVTEFTVAGADQLLRVLTGQPAHPVPSLGTVPLLPPVPLPSGVAGLVTEVVVVVDLAGGRLTAGVSVAGTDLGQHAADVPYGLVTEWTGADPDVGAWEVRLVDVGRRLAAALFDEAVLAHLAELVDGAALGSRGVAVRAAASIRRAAAGDDARGEDDAPDPGRGPGGDAAVAGAVEDPRRGGRA